jgi:hypothetical protein
MSDIGDEDFPQPIKAACPPIRRECSCGKILAEIAGEGNVVTIFTIEAACIDCVRKRQHGEPEEQRPRVVGHTPDRKPGEPAEITSEAYKEQLKKMGW